MTSKPRNLDVTDAPELLHWAEEVQRTGVGRVLTRGERALAVLSPVESRSEEAAESIGSDDARDSVDSTTDTILNIIGLGESAEPTDIAAKELEYLAEAITPRTR